MFRHFNVLLSGDTTKKRKRGRPTKSEMLARQQAEREETIERKAAKLKAAEPQQAEEDEDDVVDAGAIDDPEGEKEIKHQKSVCLNCVHHSPACPAPLFRHPDDSDYNPADADCDGRPPPVQKKSTPPISSSSSQGRPRRKVGRPRKYSLLDEGYNEQGLYHF